MHALETERLILRPVTTEELDDIHRILVNEIEGESFTTGDFQEEVQFDLHLARQPLGQKFGRLAIFLKTESRCVGYCVLMPRLCTPEEVSLYETPASATHQNSIEAEIGWAVSHNHRNKGYATEAARALVEYGFGELRLPRILAFTDSGNPASISVMRKLGMRIGQHPETGAVAGRLPNQDT